MRSSRSKNLLLINGFSLPAKMLDDFLTGSATDINILLSCPFGVLTLGAWCRQEFPNFNIEILDNMMNLHKYIADKNSNPLKAEDFIKEILNQVKFTPDFIGLSVICSNGHKLCLETARLCKKKWPKSKIIVGGVHATTFTHKIITDSNVDYIIRGAGDVAFPDLIECLLENKSPADIPGIVTSLKDISKMAMPYNDLDKIPPLPYDLIDMEYLICNDSTSPIEKKGVRIGSVFMSRGCPFGCTFCSADKVHGRRVFFIGVTKMVDNIEHLIKTYKVNTICIMDDLFGADKKYFEDFFRLIKERDLKFDIAIAAGLNLKIFNEEMIDTLIKHGLTATTFPLESGSKFVQDHIMKKRIDLDKALGIITYAKNRGLFTGVNIVIGLPGETRELVQETYNFLKKLPVDWISFFVAYPYPQTEMTNILLRRGDVTEDGLLKLWEYSTQSFKPRSFDTQEFLGEELSELVYDFNINLNFFSNYNIRTRNYSNIVPKLDKIIRRYPFHVVALACRAKCHNQLGQDQEANQDASSIVNLIKNNAESKKMFERYERPIRKTIDFAGKLIDKI